MDSVEAKGMLEFEKVEHTPKKETGYVSSVNDQFILIKFDGPLNKLGWDNTTAEACPHEDVKALPHQYAGWFTDPSGTPDDPKSFIDAMTRCALPSKEVERRMDQLGIALKIKVHQKSKGFPTKIFGR